MTISAAFLTDLSPLWLEDGRRCVTRHADCRRDVKMIVETMAKVIRTKEPLFDMKEGHQPGRAFATPLGRAFFQCASVDTSEIDRHFKAHRLNPLYTIFRRYCAGLAECGDRLTSDVVPDLNAAVGKIRAFGKGAALRRRLGNARRCERANARAGYKLVSAVRAQYSKTLAIRIDLGYFSLYGPGGFVAQAVTLKEAQAHRDEFLAYLRRGPFGRRLTGYIWKLEFGLEKGFHFHFVILLDGQKLHKDITIGAMLGGQWKTITEGKGVYFNCNQKKEAYAECGIGMINRNDEEKWSYLFQRSVRYLTKMDLYLRFQTPAKSRSFGLGGPYRSTPGS